MGGGSGKSMSSQGIKDVLRRYRKAKSVQMDVEKLVYLELLGRTNKSRKPIVREKGGLQYEHRRRGIRKLK